MSVDRQLQRLWYGDFHPFLLPLIPLSWLFRCIVGARRAAFRWRLLRSCRVAKPVIVVGNLTVGGTGKTPFTIWLANSLAEQGWRVGVILRGYGGTGTSWPKHVSAETPWEEVGDEASLLARRTQAIVVAGPDRVADAQRAIELGAQVVISDDGLQHYRLQRDIEIVVIDSVRQLGNGRLLPAGPLREPRTRMAKIDLQVITRRSPDSFEPFGGHSVPVVAAIQRLHSAVNLVTQERRSLTSFRGKAIHAVAAIGHPESFFQALRQQGLELREYAYPDHAKLTREDISFADEAAVLMTEKDAVKCSAFADDRHWAVPLEIELSHAERTRVHDLVLSVLKPA